ncbi:hypothetical protein KAR91_81080 [Candidatus Pacearchaeota archaeon]|nr:hypothetical protein [Candidatus Pacearchaeota archaeon]
MNPFLKIFISGLLTWCLVTNVNALPTFSRLTQMNCLGCHYSSMPALNETGRQYQSNGYTIDKDPIDKYFNSFSPSVFARVSYLQRGGQPHESFEWPNKASLYLAGPIARRVSYLMEVGVEGGEKESTGDQVNGLLSSKIIFKAGRSSKTQYQVIPFSTYDQGPGYPLEMMNTGGRQALNSIDVKTSFSAAEKLGISQSKATGMALAAIGEDYYLTFSWWVPAWWKDEKTQNINQCANYLRYARFDKTDQWSIGYGLQSVFHYASNDSCSGSFINDMRGAVADIQFERNTGRPLGVYASYGRVAPNTYHNNQLHYETALGIGVKSEVMDNLSLYITTMHYSDGSTSGGVKSDTQTSGIEYRFGEQSKLDFYSDNDGNAVIQFDMGI